MFACTSLKTIGFGRAAYVAVRGLASSQAPRCLTGKVALISGGGTGIGQGIALELARAGAFPVICGRTQKTLDESQAHFESLGIKCATAVADASKAADVEKLVASTIEQHGSLDILVNNAGIEGYMGPLEDMPEDAYDAVMDANFKSQFLFCKAVIPHMKARSQRLVEEAKAAGVDDWATLSEKRLHAGSIINLSSIAGKRGFANLSIYASTNFARIGLTQSLALELAPFHINVNAICPGIVWTPIWARLAGGIAGSDEADAKFKAFQDSINALIPMKRPQYCSEMGEMAVYFASQPNMTGQSVALDGGYCA